MYVSVFPFNLNISTWTHHLCGILVSLGGHLVKTLELEGLPDRQSSSSYSRTI